MEEGVDPKQVPFGTLTTAENVEWRKSGRLEKRDGSRQLTRDIDGGGEIPSAARLIVRGDELSLTTGDELYSYAGTKWVSRGRHPSVGLTWETIQDSVLGVRASDVAYLTDNRIVHAWVTGDVTESTTGGHVWFQIVDATTGAIITPPTQIDSLDGTLRVRVLALDTSYVILWIRSGHLYSYVDGTKTDLQSDAVATGSDILIRASMDACVIGTDFVIIYPLDAGDIQLRRYTIASTPALVVSNTMGDPSIADVRSVSIDGADGESLYIAYADGDVFFVAANPSTLAPTAGPMTVYNATGGTHDTTTVSVLRYDATSCVFAYSLASAVSDYHGRLGWRFVDNAGVASGGRTTFFTKLLSRPFALGTKLYVLAGPWVTVPNLTEDIQGSDTYLLDLNSSGIAGKVDLLIGGFWSPGYATTPVAISDEEVVFPCSFQATASSKLSSIRQGLRLVHATTGKSIPQDMWRSVAIGQESYIAAGVLTAYDGVEASAFGWAHPIFIDPTRSTVSAVGGTLATGTYIYNTTPERRTAAGVLHRGPQAIDTSFSVTGPTGFVGLVAVPGALSRWSSSGEIVALYRNAGGATPSGSTLQRITVEPTYSFMTNANSNFLAYVDSSPDNAIGGVFDITSRPLMYTVGELDDFQPPALLTLALYRDRIFGISGDERAVWFTKNHADNPGVAPGFHPAFRFVFNERLTGLAVLDERLLIFAETGIYYTSGDGPAPNGDGADYGVPNRLQTDVGCTNPRGIVASAEGVYFVAGPDTLPEIHLLDRKLNVQWIGKRVQDLLDQYPHITSAILVSKKNQVRFTCNSRDDESGIVLVYDYVEQQWSHFTYSGQLPIADACMHGGDYTFATTDGTVWKEDPTRNKDTFDFVTSRIITAWIHAAGPLAYHSIRNFQIDGISSTPHELNIYVGFNGDDVFVQEASWPHSVAGVTLPGPIETAKVSIGTYRKCRSIRLKIEDAPPSGSEPPAIGTGQGPKWSSMGLEVGVKRGFGKLSAAQKG